MKKALLITFAIIYYMSILMICHTYVKPKPYVFKSYIPSGFRSFKEWNCWHDKNIADTNTIHIVECISTSEKEISFGGWMTSADNYIEIRAGNNDL